MVSGKTVVVRGGGDIASAIICRLQKCGLRLLVLETASPTAIRRKVCFSEAVFDGFQTIEGVTAERIESLSECQKIWDNNKVPLFVDPMADCLSTIKPLAVIDAIMAKKNCNTTLAMASITIGLGPGFYAGRDVHAAVETARGHSLGQILYDGSPLSSTGIPGNIGGYTRERVLYAPQDGTIHVLKQIGEQVEKGVAVARIGTTQVPATITGRLRGMIRNGTQVNRGRKIGDIDPRRDEKENCFTISDKARTISGSVLEALFVLARTS